MHNYAKDNVIFRSKRLGENKMFLYNILMSPEFCIRVVHFNYIITMLNNNGIFLILF